MSVTMQFKFPGGRYHATPWGHHVNEGLVEWPPSPWRISRALVAVWHRVCDDEDDTLLCSLVEALTKEHPDYWLPKATPAHTRHYMPLGKEGVTSLIFDAFLQLKKDVGLRAHWPNVQLSDEQHTLLAVLLDRMPFLGRAESWVVGELLPNESAPPSNEDLGTWVQPLLGEGIQNALTEKRLSSLEFDAVKVMAPKTPDAVAKQAKKLLATERHRALEIKEDKERIAAAKKGRNVKPMLLSPKDEERLQKLFPATVIDALYADTSALQKAGLSGVPGTLWVEYARPRTVWATPAVKRQRRRGYDPCMARFEVTSNVPPRLVDALKVGELMRRALLRLSDGAPCFVGKAENGERNVGVHEHAYYLSESLGHHGKITHINVYAQQGFDKPAREALSGLRRLFGYGEERHEIQLALLGVGQQNEFDTPLFAETSCWTSLTPFISTRHRKQKTNALGEQVGSSIDDVRRLFRQALDDKGQQNITIESIEPTKDTRLGGKDVRWAHFQTYRSKRRSGSQGARGMQSPTGFAVQLSEKIRGPFALGFGAHFGLGVFAPELK